MEGKRALEESGEQSAKRPTLAREDKAGDALLDQDEFVAMNNGACVGLQEWVESGEMMDFLSHCYRVSSV